MFGGVFVYVDLVGDLLVFVFVFDVEFIIVGLGGVCRIVVV